VLFTRPMQTNLRGSKILPSTRAASASPIFVARVGMRSPSAVDPYWTIGFGLRFEGIEAALSYELIEVVGPRLQLQLGVTPSAFQEVASDKAGATA